MHPIFGHIGRLTIHWYGVMMALGFLAGLFSWALVTRREGRSFDFLSDLLFWIMISGIVGARLAYVLADFDHYARHPMEILRVDQGGLIFYGGFLGAALALWVFARVHREPFLGLVDLVMTSLPLAHAFGRVGCFLNGCCYGATCPSAWGVSFPKGSIAWTDHIDRGWIAATAPGSLPVLPVQLFESAFNLLLYAALVVLYRRPHRRGTIAAVYLLCYPVGRFLFEFLRGDDRERWDGLDVAQWLSLALLCVGVAILAWSRRTQSLPATAGRKDT